MIQVAVVSVSLGSPEVGVLGLGGALADSEGHRGLVKLVSGAVPVGSELQLPNRGLQVLKQYFFINVRSYLVLGINCVISYFFSFCNMIISLLNFPLFHDGLKF